MRPFLPAQGAPAQGRNEVEFLMVGDHGDFQESVRMPVLSPEQHAATHDVGRRPVEADVLELLQRAGTDVKKRQEYVPYVLPDGRQILLPVDYVEVKPARTPAY